MKTLAGILARLECADPTGSKVRVKSIGAFLSFALTCRHASLCLAGILALGPIRAALGAETSPLAAHSSSNTVAEANSGPERLKHRVYLMVETNLPPAGTATNATAPKESTYHWRWSWGGWNGLDFDFSRETLLGQLLPDIAAREQSLAPRALLGRTPATNAPRLHLEEIKMSGNIGGRLDVDAAGYLTSKDIQGFDDGIEVRRARLYARGDCILLVPMSYELQIGYVPHTFSLQDSYVAFGNLAWLGELKLGEYQPPQGLEAITSSRDTTFMELATPVAALAPGSDAGVQIGKPFLARRMTWKLGLFAPGVGEDVGDASQDFGRAIMRITGLPLYHFDPDHPEATRLLHLGLSANILYSANSTVQYRSRPESYLAPYVVNTGDIPADGALVVGGEVAWVNGPLCLEGEYLHSFVRQTPGTNNLPTLNFDGLYASASWFLTGESRPYDRQNACFGRVIPRHNFNWGHGGWGAWELAARYSFVNLNSDNIQGGRMSMLMTGLNWYLHPNLKMRFEYGFGHVTNAEERGYMNIFQTRFEVDF
jgi:phosphate-selective porin OprO and OprP